MMRAAFILLLAAEPAGAQTLAIPPACTGFVTIQNANCTVDHVLRCTDDPAGWQRIVTNYGDGMDFVATYDEEGQWIDSWDGASGTRDTLGAVADPGLWSALADDGVDTFDFVTIGMDGTTTRYVGTDKLTGRMVTIDGIAMNEAVSELRATDQNGAELWSITSTGVFWMEERLALGGTVNWVMPDDAYTTDDGAVDLIFPGEAGFLSPIPTIGCAG